MKDFFISKKLPVIISAVCLVLFIFLFTAGAVFAGDGEETLFTNTGISEQEEIGPMEVPDISMEEDGEEQFTVPAASDEGDAALAADEGDAAPAADEGNAAPADSNEVVIHNGIPVVYLNIDEDQGSIEDMLNSPAHDAYCYGTIRIEVPKGFHYSDFPDLPCESVNGLAMSIRGRGNSTWSMQDEKKPFKIKLDKKADLFGLGSNKHWVLIANAYDPSLLRDRITAWLGDKMGFEFTPRGVPVDFVMTGQYYGSRYLGSYYFSENVRVDDNRLEIDELDESDTEMPEISGGYLVQNGVQENPSSPNVFYTSRKVCWATHTPSFDPEDNALLTEDPAEISDDPDAPETDEEPDSEVFLTAPELGDGYVNYVQQEYIQNYIQYIEDALFGDGFAGEDGVSYRKLMDMESAAKYWLINEVSLNGDAYSTGSTYIYKKRDAEDGTIGKLFWGPLWDFDFGWTKRIITTGFEIRGEWAKAMLYDREEGGFVQTVKGYWPEMKKALLELTEEGGVIDQYYEETKISAEQDALIYQGGGLDYKAETDDLKNWINDRVAWIDDNLDTLDNLIHKVQLIADEKVYSTAFYKNGEFLSGLDEYPKKEGYVFLGWTDEGGEFIDPNLQVIGDMTITAKYVSESEATHGEDIALRQSSDVVKYNLNAHFYAIPYIVIPTDAQYTVVEWSSSDESFATVDENGVVNFNDPGEEPRSVTLTGKLKYGGSRSFTLTVTRDSLPAPESITPKREEIRLLVGEQSPFCIIRQPELSRISVFDYVSEDESIVTVDLYGVLTAVGPGETRVHVYTTSYPEDSDAPVSLETSVNVIVRGEPESIRDAAVTGLSDKTYTASEIKPAVTVTQGGRTLEKDTDYTVSYKNNIKAGTATVTITGIGYYCEFLEKNFTIKPASISSAALAYTTKVYTGSELKPKATVKAKDGGTVKTLKQNTDYTVVYRNNINVGTATVTIKGTGNFTGTKKLTFEITKAKNPLEIKNSVVIYEKKTLTAARTFKIGASKNQGKITYTLSEKAKAANIKVSKDGVVTVPRYCLRGKYKITVKAAGNNNYQAGTKTVTIKIT